MLAILAARRPRVEISHLLFFVALWFTFFYNYAFFHNAAGVYRSPWFLASLAVFLFAITLLVLSVVCVRFLTKPVLIAVVFTGAAASTYMNSYNVVIDTTMITNILKTDTREVHDLLNGHLLLRMTVLGLLPALFIGSAHIHCANFGKEVARRAGLIGVAVLLMLVAIAPFTADYTSFFREHKILRYYANPATPLYSAVRYLGELGESTRNTARAVLGLDAHIPAADHSRELIILVVGEAARADHFALNGYARPTTPLLAKEDLVNFPQVSSCGTATAYSLPCMFSLSDRSNFDLDEAHAEENLLDVLTHAGVNVLWRDNNSDSKGVAVGVTFEDIRSPDVNPVCDVECRDVGMLHGLDDYIAAHPSGDIVVVLHQMGNHGPAYYRRYPQEFEKFTPACHTSQLEECTDAEIVNAYDNAILYTDWFLSETISFLKAHDNAFETALYYMGDHGESLGENGLYLHGLPYMMAPEAQKHVASFLWFGANYRVDRAAMREHAAAPLSHDNYFHTVLGLVEAQTGVYDAKQDLVIHAGEALASSGKHLSLP
jgi:lipid A ethanolaminephosphotransferase